MHSIQFSTPWTPRWRVADEPAIYGVARPTVYLDTSIPSYLTNRLSARLDVARNQRITDVWWRRYRSRFELRISEVVYSEAEGGNKQRAKQRLAVLESIQWLDPSPQSDALASMMLARGLLPHKAEKDANHISIAAFHAVQFLLTWNCKHMANPFIARQIVRMCESEGLRCPKICTPTTLMRLCQHERSNP